MLRAFVIIAAFAASGVFFNTFPTLNGDMHAYVQMAFDPFAFMSSPYSYRIGLPLLANVTARISGFEIPFTFAALHFAFALANGFLLARWLNLKGLSPHLSTAFVVVYYFTLPGVFQSAAWGFVDAPFYTFLLSGLIASAHGNTRALCAVVFVGVFFKENIAMLVPYYALHAWARDGFWPAVQRSIPVFAAFTLAFVGLRSGIVFRNPPGASAYGAFYRPEYFAYLLSYWGGPRQILGNVFSAYMTLWFLAAATVALEWRKKTDELALLALSVAQIPFATDIERMLIAGFPAIYALAGRFLMGAPLWVLAPALFIPILLQSAFWAGFHYREATIAGAVITVVIIARQGYEKRRGRLIIE